MPVFKPEQFVKEEFPAKNTNQPNQNLWISEAATFKSGVAIGQYLENRGASATRCLVIGTRALVDRITYPDLDRVCHRDRSLPDDVWTNIAGEPASNPYD